MLQKYFTFYPDLLTFKSWQMKEEAIKLFCFVVKRTESGLSIEEAPASLLLRLV